MSEDSGERLRAHVRAQLDGELRRPDVSVGLRRICVAVVSDLRLRSAAIEVRTSAGGEGIAATSGEDDQRLEALPFSLGEGPGRDAYDAGRPVLEPDLQQAQARWPGYAPAAVAAGAGAVFAFPLQFGALRFGVLVLHSSAPRRLSDAETTESLIFADVATELLLDASSTRGAVASGLQSTLRIRSVVYQAQGVVMVDLQVGLAEALARLRAHAYASDRDLNDVAADVVDGRLRLPRDPGPSDGVIERPSDPGVDS